MQHCCAANNNTKYISMKLSIVLFGASTLACQFGPKPTPYVEFKHTSENGDTVEFYTHAEPTLTASRAKDCSGKKTNLNVRIGVPNNGGAQNIFQGKFNTDADAGKASVLIQDGIEAYAKAVSGDVGPIVL